MNYKTIIEEGIPLIKEWINEQSEEVKETENYKELKRVLREIIDEKDYSKDAYLDIQFVLKPFELLPLKIKRLFDTSTLDNYTSFIASRYFENIEDFINLELSTSKFQGNMTKFFYNPIPLTYKTR